MSGYVARSDQIGSTLALWATLGCLVDVKMLSKQLVGATAMESWPWKEAESVRLSLVLQKKASHYQVKQCVPHAPVHETTSFGKELMKIGSLVLC